MPTATLSEAPKRKRPATDHGFPSKSTRRRNKIACDTCRERRRKCDNARPACSYCTNNALQCNYETTAQSSSSKHVHSAFGYTKLTDIWHRIELELASINQKLSQITDTMITSTVQTTNITSHSCQDFRNENFRVDKDTPFMVLGSGSMMRAISFDHDFPQLLLRIERSTPIITACRSNPLAIRRQQALEALASFSERVHVWYPLLRTGFTEEYKSTISSELAQSSEPCVALLVAAIGFATQSGSHDQATIQNLGESCLETALTYLPTILSGYSICNVQCLVLLTLYYTCLLKPCQAHDYSLLASLKIQNLLKTALPYNDASFHAQLKQLFWIVLLLEDEIGSQFDMARSGIWESSAAMELPNGQQTWYFLPNVDKPSVRPANPAQSVQDRSSGKDIVHSFLLAEISMRRMLHRCNGAVERLPSGRQIYAPRIAAELESQLKQWYDHLPDAIRFDLQPSNADTASTALPELKNFLLVQYHFCKMSIYWPAIYQAIQDGQAETSHLEHYTRFFGSYIHMLPRIIVALKDCLVHTWTLFTSLVITTMAAAKAASTPCLQSICASELRECFRVVYKTDRDLTRGSMSLFMYHDKMKKRLAADFAEVLL